jgi:uncharacterized OB-fold protein
MRIPRYWRLKGQLYSLNGTICSQCGKPFFAPRPICDACNTPMVSPALFEQKPISQELTQVRMLAQR